MPTSPWAGGYGRVLRELGSDKNAGEAGDQSTQTAFNDQAAQMHVVPLNFTSLPALSEKYHPTVKENHNGVEATVVNDQALTPDGEAFVAANVAESARSSATARPSRSLPTSSRRSRSPAAGSTTGRSG